MRAPIFVVIALAAGCSSTPAQSTQYVDGFAPPAAPAGYKRYVAPAVKTIMPGDDLNLCQWLEPPSDVDRLVVDTRGFQSIGGHHFTLYATKIQESVGTSRICTQDDMLNISFLGAIGGEGNGSNAVQLPDGLAFSLPAGMALMGNAHYINATPRIIDVQSVVDVKVADPGAALRAVGFIAVNWAGFSIPPQTQGYASDAKCTATTKLSFFMWGNHLHEYGSAETSELLRSDGSVVPMASDSGWTSEQTFNTPWVKWDPAAPFVVNPGDQFHLHCVWNNGTDQAIGFPREMCVGSGFVLEAMPQAVCDAS